MKWKWIVDANECEKQAAKQADLFFIPFHSLRFLKAIHSLAQIDSK